MSRQTTKETGIKLSSIQNANLTNAISYPQQVRHQLSSRFNSLSAPLSQSHPPSLSSSLVLACADDELFGLTKLYSETLQCTTYRTDYDVTLSDSG